MKPILNMLRDLKHLLDKFAGASGYENVVIALIGGYSVIAHGVERTTKDIDTLAIGSPYEEFGLALSKYLKTEIQDRGLTVTYIPQSSDMNGPFQHEIIYIKDPEGNSPRVDIIIARYKWELEGLQLSKPEKEIPINLLPKPYLIAMKLKAGGIKDDSDVVELYSLLTEEERTKTNELARLIHRDKKLTLLLKPRKAIKEKEDKDQLL